MADLPGWSYYKIITITGQSGAGIDYQVLLEIGDSAGGDFHLENHCTNFPQDIRITDNDGTTLLDYWVEDITADPIVVHVKVDNDLGSNQSIRVYYGKSGETTASNGDNTFIFFDGFEDGDTSDAGDFFVTPVNYASTSQAHNGTYSLEQQNDLLLWTISMGHLVLNENMVSVWMYIPSVVWRVGTIAISHSANLTTDWGAYFKFDGGKIYAYYSSAWHDTTLTYTTGWNKVSVLQGATTHDITVNGITKTSITNRYTISDINMIGVGYPDIGGGYYDDFHVHKYNSPEPTFSSAGAEQTPGGGAAPTGIFYGPLIGPFGGPI